MFISYAQNFEDVILNRLFGDRETGFYIDVGAQHPYYDSVTKAFYDRGWQGINIEPVKEYYDLLQEQRERDINLNFALGRGESELAFYELENTGLSTFDRQMAETIAQENNYNIITYYVPIKKLADICREYVTETINFLKIDVEGWEENVILGHDWQNFRPIVVLLEATIPNSPVKTQTNIPQLLAKQNYEYVYFDGLNDYYLAQEHLELKKHFVTPPNVFDKFISARVIEAQKITEQKERELQNLNDKYTEQSQDVQRLTQHLSEQRQLQRGRSDRYMQQISQLEAELSQARQPQKSMAISKIFNLRFIWLKLKRLLDPKR